MDYSCSKSLALESLYFDIPKLLAGQVRYVLKKRSSSSPDSADQNPVLLLPGALDTLEMAFTKQLTSFDPALTLVAWDPPGYGLSANVAKIWDDQMFLRDAEIAADLMKYLGFTKFSVIGWSDGAMTALIMAAKHSEVVQRVVAIAGNALLHSLDIDIYEGCREIDKWDPSAKEPLYVVYGKDKANQLWNSWCDTMKNIYSQKGGDICGSVLAEVDAPTLVIHGKQDPVVPVDHAHYLAKNLKHACTSLPMQNMIRMSAILNTATLLWQAF
ncbi:valacyclovir hydrolase-like isoform X2 [Paramacrobiotus metropolitanus]|uniref:valacyclovir hydrolase-like isoform X2 n=1 Tax=Paramacrobiotus metropolitanus TaxID=2943436 RepID=UPI00244621DE|nr:valacyclovir hydrolase-like isoform X2 [Paramacrobiotus metropolitanus]